MPPRSSGDGVSQHGYLSSESAWVERGVPTFNGEMSKYKEYRRRARLYLAKKKIEQKLEEAGVNLLSGLSGLAWDCCENIDPAELGTPAEVDKLFQLMDTQFRYDERVEAPTEFESLFEKTWRVKDQTLISFCSMMEQKLRKIAELKVVLPEALKGWLLLRRCGLSREQRTLIQSHVGTDLTFERVRQTLYFSLGQDSLPDRNFKSGAHSGSLCP